MARRNSATIGACGAVPVTWCGHGGPLTRPLGANRAKLAGCGPSEQPRPSAPSGKPRCSCSSMEVASSCSAMASPSGTRVKSGDRAPVRFVHLCLLFSCVVDMTVAQHSATVTFSLVLVCSLTRMIMLLVHIRTSTLGFTASSVMAHTTSSTLTTMMKAAMPVTCDAHVSPLILIPGV